ncbi:MAG: MgtC/SapB family protein [Desulforegulaceae bacterium]|nr:MgtC/SapB family protein [Desulforegulaceae bacterium]
MFEISNEYMELGIKLLLATFLSGLVGMEREFHGRAAGLRTHIFVCLGSTMLMASSQTLQAFYIPMGVDSVFRIDPWRIPAGIVTGVGFIGGGTILKSNDLIRGLTTAACVWFIAAIGIIIGLGFYIPAIAGTAIGLFVLIGLDPIGRMIPSVKYSKISIVSELTHAEFIEEQCLKILKEYPIIVQNTSVSADIKENQRTLGLDIRSRKLTNKHKHKIIEQFIEIQNVLSVVW